MSATGAARKRLVIASAASIRNEVIVSVWPM
jgi:hypothetical protein